MKILVAMSGGVDSSVCAMLLRQRGYETLGATLKFHNGNDADITDAKAVCEGLDIPFYSLDVREDFENTVIDSFIKTYEGGGTPNPCVYCNRYCKFKNMLMLADELGCEKIATGHYARIEKIGDRYALKKAIDTKKDQSYMLSLLSNEQLKRIVLPLGELTKEETRALALSGKLPTADKHDSQDICFIKDESYLDFLERKRGKKYDEGDFIDKYGNTLGKHRGAVAYTVGQRKGLGIALGEPKFVTAIDTEKNTVTLGGSEELFNDELYLNDFNNIYPYELAPQFRAEVKVRYSQNTTPAKIKMLKDRRLYIKFDTPVRAITKGQIAVLYDGDTVIGGGIIE